MICSTLIRGGGNDRDQRNRLPGEPLRTHCDRPNRQSGGEGGGGGAAEAGPGQIVAKKQHVCNHLATCVKISHIMLRV